MVQDPYKVLGISESATQDEIKKAYRKKAKENHPDLHPDDPQAGLRMNDINEAYDMLMNPEKYAGKRQQANGYRPTGGYQNTGGSQQSSGNYQQQSGGNQNYGGYGNFGGFDFNDLFGFGGGYSNPLQANVQAGDSQAIRDVVQLVNGKNYQGAINVLNTIPSTGRNARWYYLSALANYGANNTLMALEQIRKAYQMEPNNMEYRQTLQMFQQAGQTYQQYGQGQGYNMRTVSFDKICLSLCAAQMFCQLCGGGMGMPMCYMC